MFADELNFSYRNSRCQRENLVLLDATLSLSEREDPTEILERMRAMNKKRRATQPLEFPSAGSVFRRVDRDVPLSRTLDLLGCKGMRVGDAMVSNKHAGFIVNVGHATAADVKELIDCLQNKLEKERGIRPQTELRFIP
jgi:UDP-N-acetylmuramate dehydrogenase